MWKNGPLRVNIKQDFFNKLDEILLDIGRNSEIIIWRDFEIYVRVVRKIGKDDSWLFNLQFADDQVIVANDKEDIQYIIRKLMGTELW